jgi:hypothetical protein
MTSEKFDRILAEIPADKKESLVTVLDTADLVRVHLENWGKSPSPDLILGLTKLILDRMESSVPHPVEDPEEKDLLSSRVKEILDREIKDPIYGDRTTHSFSYSEVELFRQAFALLSELGG